MQNDNKKTKNRTRIGKKDRKKKKKKKKTSSYDVLNILAFQFHQVSTCVQMHIDMIFSNAPTVTYMMRYAGVV